LQRCKDRWSASSSSVDDVFKRIGLSLVLKHAYDLIDHSHLSVGQLTEISKVSGIKVDELTMCLVEYFASPNIHIPAAIWIALASRICPKATIGEPQLALSRLLQGNAGKLSSNVAEGAWKKDYILRRINMKSLRR
jgi:hypothetical protein